MEYSVVIRTRTESSTPPPAIFYIYFEWEYHRNYNYNLNVDLHCMKVDMISYKYAKYGMILSIYHKI